MATKGVHVYVDETEIKDDWHKDPERSNITTSPTDISPAAVRYRKSISQYIVIIVTSQFVLCNL